MCGGLLGLMKRPSSSSERAMGALMGMRRSGSEEIMVAWGGTMTPGRRSRRLTDARGRGERFNDAPGGQGQFQQMIMKIIYCNI